MKESAFKVPAFNRAIERRVLVSFTVDPDVLQKQLPARLRPKLIRGM